MTATKTKPSEGALGKNEPTLDHLLIERVLISDVSFLSRRVRKHSRKNIHKLEKAISKYGQVMPILLDSANHIVDGEAVLQAMKILGFSEINIIRVADLSEEDIKIIRLMLNRLQEGGEWNEENLALEFESLSTLDIDLSITGFDAVEIDYHLNILADPTPDEAADQLPLLSEVQERVSLNQVWKCGDHYLICADATDTSVYAWIATHATFVMMFTDPPYNVPINGNVCGKGKIKHSEFVMASGEMSKSEFTNFLLKFLIASSNSLQDGALLYVCMDWRHIQELSTAAEDAGLTLINLCVWNKTNAGMGSLYRSQHELVFVLKKGDSTHQNNVELGKHGRNRTNVWSYPSVNSNDNSRKGDLSLHPTVKPLQLVIDAIYDVTTKQDWILDPFGGSGTTMLAAEQTGRKSILVELDPHYCDVILTRFEQMTGINPELICSLDESTDNTSDLANAEQIGGLSNEQL